MDDASDGVDASPDARPANAQGLRTQMRRAMNDAGAWRERPEDEPEPAYDPLIDSPEAIRARHWLQGGIVFTVVGGVLTIGGIAMSTAKVNVPGSPDQPCDARGDPAGNGCTPGGRTRAVAALTIPGALLLAGGVAMLVVGKLQQRRVRASLQADKRGFMIGASLRF